MDLVLDYILNLQEKDWLYKKHLTKTITIYNQKFTFGVLTSLTYLELKKPLNNWTKF